MFDGTGKFQRLLPKADMPSLIDDLRSQEVRRPVPARYECIHKLRPLGSGSWLVASYYGTIDYSREQRIIFPEYYEKRKRAIGVGERSPINGTGEYEAASHVIGPESNTYSEVSI